jgi:hypothetical protein
LAVKRVQAGQSIVAVAKELIVKADLFGAYLYQNCLTSFFYGHRVYMLHIQLTRQF